MLSATALAAAFLALSLQSPLVFAAPASKSDFILLQKALTDKFVTPTNIPKLIRMSFHDLLNFDKATGSAGAQGCIFDQKIIAFQENNGLNSTAQELKAFVTASFPTTQFSSGDIVSLAGKVAVEKAFPCIQVKWSFGRNSCTAKEIEGGPGPEIRTLSQMQPFLNRYGLNSTEMAVLTSGAHGIAGAVNSREESKITSFTFAQTSSGVDFIKKTVTEPMFFFGDWYGNFAPSTFKEKTFGRFPSDMMFFPDTVAKAGATPDLSPEIANVQKTLLSLNDEGFNRAFGDVYAKMLLIGTSLQLTPFSDGAISSSCFPVVKSSTTISSSTSVVVSTTISSSTVTSTSSKTITTSSVVVPTSTTAQETSKTTTAVAPSYTASNADLLARSQPVAAFVPENFALTFDITPSGVINGEFGSIIHFTQDDTDVSRVPAIWFQPGTTKLHVRASTSASWNEGIDSSYDLPLNRKTTVRIEAVGRSLTVFFDGVMKDKTLLAGKRIFGKVKMYMSDPWFPPAKAAISNVNLYSATSLAYNTASCSPPSTPDVQMVKSLTNLNKIEDGDLVIVDDIGAAVGYFALTSPPSETTNIWLTASDGTTLSSCMITFNAQNWNVPQPVTIVTHGQPAKSVEIYAAHSAAAACGEKRKLQTISIPRQSGWNDDTCSSTGDPHMVLFDGSHFEFQKYGAYELVNSIGAVVQADTQPCWGGMGAYCNRKVAVSYGGHSLIIDGSVNGEVEKLYHVGTNDNGIRWSVSDQSAQNAANYKSVKSYYIYLPDGSTIKVVSLIYKHSSGKIDNYMDIEINMAPRHVGYGKGLCSGNINKQRPLEWSIFNCYTNLNPNPAPLYGSPVLKMPQFTCPPIQTSSPALWTAPKNPATAGQYKCQHTCGVKLDFGSDLRNQKLELDDSVGYYWLPVTMNYPVTTNVTLIFTPNADVNVFPTNFIFNPWNWNVTQFVLVTPRITSTQAASIATSVTLPFSIVSDDTDNCHLYSKDLTIKRTPASSLFCQSTGDPHIIDYQGNMFDSSGVGAKYLLRTVNDDLVIQTFQTPCLGYNGVFCNSAIAVKYKSAIWLFDGRDKSKKISAQYLGSLPQNFQGVKVNTVAGTGMQAFFTLDIPTSVPTAFSKVSINFYDWPTTSSNVEVYADVQIALHAFMIDSVYPKYSNPKSLCKGNDDVFITNKDDSLFNCKYGFKMMGYVKIESGCMQHIQPTDCNSTALATFKNSVSLITDVCKSSAGDPQVATFIGQASALITLPMPI